MLKYPNMKLMAGITILLLSSLIMLNNQCQNINYPVDEFTDDTGFSLVKYADIEPIRSEASSQINGRDTYCFSRKKI